MGGESVFVYLIENGELDGLLSSINRSSLKYEHLLAQRRLLEDLSGKREMTNGFWFVELYIAADTKYQSGVYICKLASNGLVARN